MNLRQIKDSENESLQITIVGQTIMVWPDGQKTPASIINVKGNHDGIEVDLTITPTKVSVTTVQFNVTDNLTGKTAQGKQVDDDYIGMPYDFESVDEGAPDWTFWKLLDAAQESLTSGTIKSPEEAWASKVKNSEATYLADNYWDLLVEEGIFEADSYTEHTRYAIAEKITPELLTKWFKEKRIPGFTDEDYNEVQKEY